MIDIKKSNAVYDFNVSLCFAEYVMHISQMIKGKFFEADTDSNHYRREWKRDIGFGCKKAF